MSTLFTSRELGRSDAFPETSRVRHEAKKRSDEMLMHERTGCPNEKEITMRSGARVLMPSAHQSNNSTVPGHRTQAMSKKEDLTATRAVNRKDNHRPLTITNNTRD